MGNKLGRRRQVVDEKYTKPQGLYQHRDVDHKKLRKLILDSKLAPCYPGDDDCTYELEECPICFLYYPSLNRSRCCMKGICTECFLQMKAPNSTRPTQCPFCKTSNYAVEYRGMRTKEEKGMEQIEEQRVIEAKIRMRQQELLDEEEKMQKRREISSSSSIMAHGEAEQDSVEVQSFRSAVESEEIVSSQDLCPAPTSRQPLRSRQNRDDEFDMDLEDIMVMEAIWLSIQENGRPKNPTYADSLSQQYTGEDHYTSPSTAQMAESSSSSSSSPSGGLACAIAALAERQQMSGESTTTTTTTTTGATAATTAVNMLPHPGYSRFFNRHERVAETYSSGENSVEISPEARLVRTREEREWGVVDEHGSGVAEAGPSYASSDAAHDESEGRFHQPGAGSIVPESFEEQMMLAVAVSLAEARTRTNAQGLAAPWL